MGIRLYNSEDESIFKKVLFFTLRQHSVWKSVGLCRKRWLQFTPGLAAWPDIGIVEASEDTGTMSGDGVLY